jgi:translation elongation factor EF-G
VLEGDPRLVEALYLCSIQSSTEALSGVYAVLGRRRARILREDMREGSDQFLVHAHLPVESSFGLAEELRRRCSGAASASLMLSHWERLQVRPAPCAATIAALVLGQTWRWMGGRTVLHQYFSASTCYRQVCPWVPCLFGRPAPLLPLQQCVVHWKM